MGAERGQKGMIYMTKISTEENILQMNYQTVINLTGQYVRFNDYGNLLLCLLFYIYLTTEAAYPAAVITYCSGLGLSPPFL